MNRLNAYWHWFSAAPHRMFFFTGALQTVCTILWWLTDLSGRFLGLYSTFEWTIPPTDIHAFLMIYGMFSFFIFGFLMTTYPRWMQGEEVSRQQYILSWALMTGGIFMFYAGVMSVKWILDGALLIFLSGWTAGLYALLRVYLRAKHPDKRHATITSLMLICAWLLIVSFISGQFELVQFAKRGGIWLFLLPLFFAVSHRMIPFFSANVIIGYDIIRPYWVLVAVLLLAGAHLIMESVSLNAWLWITDLPMALMGLYLTVKWQILQSLKVPLLAMLHISFAWFGIALSLYSIQSFYLLVSGQFILLKAPLHALVIGYFSSMLLAMATRVTLGHSGRPLAADKISWGVFLCFQLVAVIRVISDLPGLTFSFSSKGYVIAATLWLICFGVWAYKFAPLYLRQRADSKAG